MTNENIPAKDPVSYDDRIAQQEVLVSKLVEDYKKDPSAEIQMQLKRKSDALLHLKNLAKGNPKERGRQAAEKARSSTLSKAVTQPLSKP
jgi:hypothetical protein